MSCASSHRARMRPARPSCAGSRPASPGCPAPQPISKRPPRATAATSIRSTQPQASAPAGPPTCLRAATPSAPLRTISSSLLRRKDRRRMPASSRWSRWTTASPDGATATTSCATTSRRDYHSASPSAARAISWPTSQPTDASCSSSPPTHDWPNGPQR